MHFALSTTDPRWAVPIKNRIRERAQVKAIAEVVGNLKPTKSELQSTTTTLPDGTRGPVVLPPLRVMNGLSTQSTITASTADTITPNGAGRIDGLPSPRGNGWPLGSGPNSLPLHQTPIAEHPEPSTVSPRRKQVLEGAGLDRAETFKAIPETSPPIPPPKSKPINPTLLTLEKAASARIYFENLYFPLLRQPPSREQRRVAMEREMDQMGMNEETKLVLRDRWRQNETDYLREQRKKVRVTAFTQLKVIGHGE